MLFQNSDASRNLLGRVRHLFPKPCLRSSPISHLARSSPKQQGLMKQFFGSARLNAVLSNVTTVLTLESIAVRCNSNPSKG